MHAGRLTGHRSVRYLLVHIASAAQRTTSGMYDLAKRVVLGDAPAMRREDIEALIAERMQGVVEETRKALRRDIAHEVGSSEQLWLPAAFVWLNQILASVQCKQAPCQRVAWMA
jgi:hypothetical protein